jgi:hypothetical protein
MSQGIWKRCFQGRQKVDVRRVGFGNGSSDVAKLLVESLDERLT